MAPLRVLRTILPHVPPGPNRANPTSSPQCTASLPFSTVPIPSFHPSVVLHTPLCFLLYALSHFPPPLHCVCHWHPNCAVCGMSMWNVASSLGLPTFVYSCTVPPTHPPALHYSGPGKLTQTAPMPMRFIRSFSAVYIICLLELPTTLLGVWCLGPANAFGCPFARPSPRPAPRPTWSQPSQSHQFSSVHSIVAE
eukprot:EG_transcript_13978